MPLITRGGKGSKLTIPEMDGNLIYLNNNPLLLGKITADLNLEVREGAATLITDCLDPLNGLFVEGETITFSSMGVDSPIGTATVVSVQEYVGLIYACATIGQSLYELKLEDVTLNLGAIPIDLIAYGETSGITTPATNIISNNYGPSQAITLNPNGSLFKINEIILTNINGTPFETTGSFVHTDIDGGGDLVAVLASGGGGIGGGQGVSSLIDSNQWIGMQLGVGGQNGQIGSTYDYLVGNTLYFSVDAEAGEECTVDVYVFGYTIA
jgi:hypothetical protein